MRRVMFGLLPSLLLMHKPEMIVSPTTESDAALKLRRKQEWRKIRFGLQQHKENRNLQVLGLLCRQTKVLELSFTNSDYF